MRAGKIAQGLALALIAHLSPAGAHACDCTQGGDFQLRYVDSATTQITLAWQSVAGATNYVLERTTSCDFSQATAYTLPPFLTAYGDTGHQPADRCRFPGMVDIGYAASHCYYTTRLNPGTPYTYRVKAVTGAGQQISNCVTAQLTSGPVRGVAGDLWADVVLGKPDFGQNAFLKTTANGVEIPGGIRIEKRHSGRPARVYVADSNHNRILGFDHLGTCSGQPCTSDADCDGTTCALDYPNLLPRVVLGQPGSTDKSACNGDGTGQFFPGRAPASATSLCLVPPDQISIGESVYSALMDTDDSGALYVPDVFNNRVLRYADPFASQV